MNIFDDGHKRSTAREFETQRASMEKKTRTRQACPPACALVNLECFVSRRGMRQLGKNMRVCSRLYNTKNVGCRIHFLVHPDYGKTDAPAGESVAASTRFGGSQRHTNGALLWFCQRTIAHARWLSLQAIWSLKGIFAPTNKASTLPLASSSAETKETFAQRLLDPPSEKMPPRAQEPKHR